MSLSQIIRKLAGDVRRMHFGPPVAYVYNPLEYAIEPHLRYVNEYARSDIEVLLLGMNPGPWGMAQTGIPFGEVDMVRDWLGINEQVRKPKPEHPKRPVEGFSCHRREVSGARLWGWARDTFATPKRFFSRFFVVNYCPLCFLEKGGRNLTPDKLPIAERKPLMDACDRALRETVLHLKPRKIVGVGGFAELRARAALADLGIPIGRISHPSPASPTANRGWAKLINGELKDFGIELPRPRPSHAVAG